MKIRLSRNELRKKRRNRSKKNLLNNLDLSRVIVYKSSKHLSANLMEQQTGKTICGVTTCSKNFNNKHKVDKPIDKATFLGEKFGDLLKTKNITSIVFDRNGFKYHGRVKAFAESLRKKGINF